MFVDANVSCVFFMRKVSVSLEAIKKLKNKAKRVIKSNLPIDRYDCICQKEITRIKKTPSKPAYLECPRDRTGMEKYEIICAICKSKIAELYATDVTLTDWCDLHYFCEHDSKEWKGCMAVNISPIDGKLGFECTCGNDTRDFRANTTLKPKDLAAKIKETEVGREFTKDSKFLVRKVK